MFEIFLFNNWFSFLRKFKIQSIIIIIIISTPLEFFPSASADVFPLEFEWQVSRTRLRILAVLNNAVV